MCLDKLNSDASVAALVGSLTATIGLWILWRTQVRYEKEKKSTEEREKYTSAGHSAMLAIEAQRTFAEAIGRTVEEYNSKRESVEDIPSVYASHTSVPRIPLQDLQFISVLSKDKNTLPALTSLQQTFDQLIDNLNRCAEERRSLHFAEPESRAYKATAVYLVESDQNDLIP